MNMNKVKYTIKDYKDYDSGIYKDFVYFAKDKKKVIVNGVEYGLDVLSDDISILESIEFKDNKLKLKYTNGKEDEIELYDPNKYWDELTVVEEFPKGGCIIKTLPIKEFSFKGGGSGNWYSSDGQEGLYTASDKTITFEEEGEYTLKFVNNYNDGYNGLQNVTDNSVKIVLMIGGSNGETRGINPVNKNENAKLILYNNITSIGEMAFDKCSGFTGELKLPESLTSIGSMAFANCSGFSELKLPESITNIGGMAFYYCSGFTGELKLPESLTSIGNNAFTSCSGFTGELILPESVTSIGNSAFDGCSGFTSLKLPESLTSIKNNAFYNCDGFTGELILPESVTSIGNRAFWYCSGFTGDLIIPENVTSIGINAFQYCSGLSKIYVCEDTTLAEDWNANTTAEVITYKKGETPWIS